MGTAALEYGAQPVTPPTSVTSKCSPAGMGLQHRDLGDTVQSTVTSCVGRITLILQMQKLSFAEGYVTEPRLLEKGILTGCIEQIFE